jgi:hypothetical protein
MKGKTMSIDENSDKNSQYKKIIRENYLFRETEELVQILHTSDPADWEPETFDVIKEILAERGEDINTQPVNGPQIKKEVFTPIPLYTEKQSLYKVPYWDGKPGFALPYKGEAFVRHLEDSTAELECAFCNARIPADARFCPKCGNALYPDSFEQEVSDEPMDEELFASLDALSLEELEDELSATDLRDLSRNEIIAWRCAFNKFEMSPVALYDQGEVLRSFYPYLTDEALYLLGHPGNRTLPGKWGVDYIETNAEIGYELGILLEKIIHFSLRTKNPFFILVLFYSSFFCLLPIVGFFTQNEAEAFFFIPLIIIGVYLLINATLCVIAPMDESEN